MQIATRTMKIGPFTKPITKAKTDRASVICDASDFAMKHNAVVLVKRVWDGRWQGFQKKADARGVAHPEDYEWLPTGRRAKKRAVVVAGGEVWVADTSDGAGTISAERHWPL